MDAKRLSLSLTPEASRKADFLSTTQGVSLNEAIRKAIATEAYLLEARQSGAKVLLQMPDGEIREVIFR